MALQECQAINISWFELKVFVVCIYIILELKLLENGAFQLHFIFIRKTSEVRNYLVRKRVLLNRATNNAVGDTKLAFRCTIACFIV